MRTSIYIYHHLGLGDHIICNGLVRHFSKNYEKVYLFVKDHNFKSVSFMYRDLINIDFILVKNDNDAVAFIRDNRVRNLLKIGFDNLDTNGCTFDESFYKQCGINFSYRWSNFYVKRDNIREKILFEKFNIQENNYVFLHDDKERGFEINREYIINKNLKIITPSKGLTDNIFDYCYVIENAAEIHCMDSSFKLLIDSLNPVSEKLYYHLYVRGRDNNHISSSRLKWIKIFYKTPFLNNIIGKIIPLK